ncbi:acyl-CoA dehydrogenase family protein [Paludifilum halophilum]|uniref:Acyl-CoA dehydrogenase n=1 Tax=Paludifilum halophilum TaxID=1642702 RepID=A0A235B9Z0_9BACL|nr:acyl-CoA dehydrogenase family protein [Paludifilum halophilum]OYD09086.1 acyl-CoA dehydrogenase [Paludifilum halophilum]
MNTKTRSIEAYRRQLVEEAHVFADREIRPFAADFDERGQLSKDLIGKMAERGYLSASFPERYGGLALDPVHYGLFTEVIGKACCNVRTLITVNTSLIGETLLRYGTEEQKNEWLPKIASGEKVGAFALSEPLVGSDAKNVQTAYRREGNKYVLNGKKKWISFGDLADFFIVIAGDRGQVTAFLVERTQGDITSTPIQGMMANRASHIAEIEFKNVEVPAENVLGPVGGGFAYIVSTALDHGRYSIAWAGVAIAQEAVNAMVAYARTRSQFGERLHQHQLIKGMIGDSITQLHAARALCRKAGELRRDRDAEAVIETSIAKYFASKAAMQLATDNVQIHGGNGISNQYPAERLFREAKVLEIIEGTSQLQQQMISDYGLQKYFVKRPNLSEERSGH